MSNMPNIGKLPSAEEEMMASQQWRWRSLWDKGLKELAIVGAIFLCYRISSGALNHGFDLASQNAYHVVNLEKSLGIFIEPDLQSFFMNSTFLTHFFNTIYTIFYYPALIIFAIWAFRYHRQQYLVVRNVFLASAAIAFTCFALFPVAPPRMLYELGFIDTMATNGAVHYDSSILSSLANPYAAMPSLHFGWTLLIGIAIINIARSWWLKAVGILLPLGMLISIVATANHFILDALGSAVVIGLAYGTVKLLSTLRKVATSLAFEDMD
jgi:hypothetical protein